MSEKKPTCGRCGVYRHLHPTARCQKPRLSWWWDRHSLTEHVGAWLWIHAIPSRARWAICERIKSGKRDWCELVDCCIYADDWAERRGDYSGEWGCLCDFPTPWHVGPVRAGWCYCPPEIAPDFQPPTAPEATA